MILLDFPCFIGILAVLGFWKPKNAKRTSGSFHFHACTGGGSVPLTGPSVLLTSGVANLSSEPPAEVRSQIFLRFSLPKVS